jgi:membrane protease YdiL (CAAX protease family)
MLTAARHAIGRSLASLRRLTVAPDPVLLQGREGRWRWPWALAGLLLAALLFLLLSLGVTTFEEEAVRSQWVSGGFPQNVFPLDPAQPITYLDVLLASLSFLVPPLIVLPVVHRVPWRRALSWGGGFRWGQFWRAALALMTLSLVALILGYAWEPQQYKFPAHPPGHALWIALAAAVIFVQSFGEEVLFRGYLVRSWGAVLPLRLPVTAAVVALFVAGHVGNDDLQTDLVLNVAYFLAGEVVAYAVLFRTENLAASAGLHWMNNLVALLMPTVPGQPTALALAVYTDPVYAAGGSRLLDPFTHVTGIAGLVLLVALLYWPRSPFYLEPARERGGSAGLGTGPAR